MLFGKYLLPALLPFVIAYASALMLRPGAVFLSEKTGKSEKLCELLLLAVLASVLLSLIALSASALFRELRELGAGLAEDGEGLRDTVAMLFEKIGDAVRKIPFIGKTEAVQRITGDLEGFLLEKLSENVPEIAAACASMVAKPMMALPNAALFLLVTLLAAFYFASDIGSVNSFLSSLLPKKPRKLAFLVKNELFSVVFGYLRAYSALCLMTFTELYIGFLLIGTEYRLLSALLISLIDILPVLGTGAVLVPWGLFELWLGDLRRGICLLVLYGVITLVRELAEPRIVGGFLGLHPAFALLAMYAGLRLFGIAGLFLLPMAFVVGKNVRAKVRSGNGGEDIDTGANPPPFKKNGGYGKADVSSSAFASSFREKGQGAPEHTQKIKSAKGARQKKKDRHGKAAGR